MRDVDTRAGVLFVETFKGRARWVPFHRTLSRELGRFLAERAKYAPAGPETRFFVGVNRRVLPVSTAHGTIRSEERRVGRGGSARGAVEHEMDRGQRRGPGESA